MALRQAKLEKGQRVTHDDHACEILEVKPRVLIVRNKFGYREEIPRKTAKLAD